VIPDSIERDVLVDAPVDVVWTVVTEPAKLMQWFSDLAELDLRPGGAGVFAWTAANATAPLVVQEVDAPRKFSFRWVHPEGETPREGNSTLVEILLSAEGDGTRLRIVESGLSSLDWTDERKEHFVADHGQGWGKHVVALASYLQARSEVTAPAHAGR